MNVVVVGSGPSGVHFALTALRKGANVKLVDVGNSAKTPPFPDQGLSGLKSHLDDPYSYFLGPDYKGAVLPLPAHVQRNQYYGLPPSKDHVFAHPDRFSMHCEGFAPLISFAAGGLAECWTAGAYPFNDAELANFPFQYSDIAPHYASVAETIGIGGLADDLSDYIPVHNNLLPPVELDYSSSLLLDKYEARKARLLRRHNIKLGRSRQATISVDLDERKACSKCGRCLWGCPTAALYTPSQTLRQCMSYQKFEYLPARFASHFSLSDSATLDGLIVYPTDGGKVQTVSGDIFVLAAGALNTSNLYLRTLWQSRREVIKLTGLMDNRQIHAPFYNLAMLGKAHDPLSYQYHQLAVGMPCAEPANYIHGQITTLTNASAHPIIQQLPLDLKSATEVYRQLRSGIGVLNINFSDTRRSTNFVALDPNRMDRFEWPALSVHYSPRRGEKEHLRDTVREMAGFFRDIGAPIIPGMTVTQPMGYSVHYAGTLPMKNTAEPHALSPNCQSYEFGNLYVVDGAAFPFLPAKNLTFTLMANATRVAANLF